MDLEEAFTDDANSMTGNLIDGAAEKVQWARQKAVEFLEHADSLEERANSYRHLAGLMLVEAQSYAGEISDLLAAEFPTEDTPIGNEEPEDE